MSSAGNFPERGLGKQEALSTEYLEPSEDLVHCLRLLASWAGVIELATKWKESGFFSCAFGMHMRERAVNGCRPKPRSSHGGGRFLEASSAVSFKKY